MFLLYFASSDNHKITPIIDISNQHFKPFYILKVNKSVQIVITPLLPNTSISWDTYKREIREGNTEKYCEK